MFRSLLIIIVITLLFGCKSNKESDVQNVNSIKEEKKIENTTETTKVEEKKVEVDVNDLELTFKDINEKTETELFIKNKKTGEEKSLVKIVDAYNEHYHSKELIKNNLFIIRRTGDIVKWTKWSDELWVYSPANTNGKKIFDLQGLDFRVSSDLKYVGIVTNDGLTIIDSDGKKLKEINISEFSKINPKATEFGALTPDKWSDDSSELLVSFIEQDKNLGSFKIIKDTWEIKFVK